MPKLVLRSKNPHNQFLLDKMQELKIRCLRTGQDKVSFIYAKIIQSLQKYPMPIICEEQVQMLQGVGDKTSLVLLQMIKAQYSEYEVPFQKLNSAIIEDHLEVIKEGDEEFDDQIYSESCPPSMIFPVLPVLPEKRMEIAPQSMFSQHLKKFIGTTSEIEPISKGKRPYNPGKDSKGGQILLGLHKFSKSKNKLFASKKEIRDEIRDLCNVEVQNWAVIGALEKHQLISKTVLDNEIKYALTEEGTKLGYQYLVETRLQTEVEEKQKPAKIVLLIDNRERYQNEDRKSISDKLQNIYNIECDLRQLPVGDFMWISKKGDDEKVLDYVIERKTMSDLANSILDKRYQVQKYRLKNCGLTKLFYLIESTQSTNLPVPRATVEKAIRNTQIIDGFFIKQTENIDESLRWLALFTKTVKLHDNAMLYSDFVFNNSKRSESIYNLWGSMLRGIPGVGLETAKVIANTWRTPAEFIDAANQDENKSLQQLIEETALVTRQLPSNIIRQIEILFTKDQYPN